MNAQLTFDESKCPLCGNDNLCEASTCEDQGISCWCVSVDFSKKLLESIPADLKNKACLCRACAFKADIEMHRL